MSRALPTKVCPVCGRTFAWRKKWERSWDDVVYCSDACRRSRLTAVDAALEAAILALLDARARSATICPSEAARVVAASAPASPAGDDGWRDLMEPARAAARRLVARGEVEITQGGQVVIDPSRAKGPIRIRRRSPGGS
ncbi:hypothetical protein acdb102_37480 [Acidothermaceae bacterium B102]|nr:hypothetical protein acdb102_37480 [Acidothermaceae bacterium B102]